MKEDDLYNTAHALPASYPDNDRYENDPYFDVPNAKPPRGRSVQRGMSLAERHADRNYRNPSVVVYCKDGDPGGYPYANQQYRAAAEAFAAQIGGTIEDWAAGCCFRIGDKKYQVVSDRNCIDVISRELTKEQREAMEILDSSFSDDVKELFGETPRKKIEAA